MPRRERVRISRVIRPGDVNAKLGRTRPLVALPLYALSLALFVALDHMHGTRLASLIGAMVFTLAVDLIVFRGVRAPSPRWSGAASLAVVLGEFAIVGITGGFYGPLSPLLFAAASTVVIAHGRARETTIAVALVAIACLAIVAEHEPLTYDVSRTTYEVLSAAATLYVVAVVTRTTLALTDAHRHAISALDAAQEERLALAQERARAIESVGAKVGHELKNPLAAIKGLMQLLDRSASDEKSKNRISVALGEIGRMENIVAEYLSFSKPLSDMKPENVQPQTIVKDVLSVLEARALASNVSLGLIGHSRPIEGDPRRLKEALLNLVANALEVTPSGGAIDVSLAEEDEHVIIAVKDGGRGLTPTELQKIGTPFYTTRQGGTGLGVVLARAVVGQHGGTLTYQSASGSGTTATVRLPIPALKKGTNRPHGEDSRS
jgi:signal transduction histidine kinase